jgi:hypothetical protein
MLHTVMQAWSLRQLLLEHFCVVSERCDFRGMSTRKACNVRLMRRSQACKLSLQRCYGLVLCRDGAFEFLYLFAPRGCRSGCSSRSELVTISICCPPHQKRHRQNNE